MKKLLMLSIMTMVIYGASSQEKDVPYTKEQLEKYKESVESHNVSCAVKGIVVDEKGQPLNDVDLNINENTFGFWSGEKETNRKKKINGEFEIETSKIRSLCLFFSKKGYYCETLSFTVNSPVEYKNLYTSNLKNGTLIANNVKVVMRAEGIPAKLDRIDENLVYNEDGSGSVINFDTKKLDAIKDMSDTKSLPENCIYIYPELTNDGKIATKIFKLNGDTVFSKVTLKVNDPEGGFIVFQNKRGDAFQYMKEAPENGYKNELTFEFTNESKHTYFYFKSKGKYGKGDIGYIASQYNDTRDSIKYINPRIELRYNPDGSRNVNGK